MAKRLLLLPLIALVWTPSGAVQAQTGTVSGTVYDEAGSGLPGATVQVQGTELGDATDNNGAFTVNNVPSGTQTFVIRFVGYALIERDVVVTSGETTTISVSLTPENRELAGLEVLADRAIDRKTPSTYTNISKDQIERQLASRDLPLVLNTAPSVYATNQGGGAGDARINVRGFDQRNTAVMINGVPINDMENGWVYWSNWDGLGDATTSIQLQRGMSAVNLAVPSVGGTLNILTDPTQMDTGVSLKQEIGSYGFVKTTLQASTGRVLNDRFALTVNAVRKTGDGFYQGTWTDAWAYYVASSFRINNANTLALYAVGAPQKHGQNLYAQNIGAYDQEFALDLDSYDPAAAEAYPEAAAGREYNENFAPVSPSYRGQQAIGSRTFSRYDSNFIMERVNFFHKPQVNLNWYSQLSDQLLLSTVTYYSGGAGGGTGTYGDIIWDYSGPSRIGDWDATIAQNQLPAGCYDEDLAPVPCGSQNVEYDKSEGQSLGILRSSRNNQWTLGAISKLTAELSDNLTAEVGIDARTASIDHYREPFDLLGGDFYLDHDDAFNPDKRATYGDKVNYYNNNTVNWLGGYVQAEVEQGPFTAFGMAGVNSTSYSYEDFFKRAEPGSNETLKLESGALTGYQLKAGGLYNVTDEVGVYVNGGYLSKTPIFDGVIDDEAAELLPDPTNEDIFSIEGGVNWRSEIAALKLAGYFTNWSNRTVNQDFEFQNGDDVSVVMRGVEQRHVGVELDAAVQPIPEVRLDAGIGIGDWSYTKDVVGSFQIVGSGESVFVEVPIEGLKVGNQPQTQFAYGVTVLPVNGLSVQFLGRTYTNYWSNFNPIDRMLVDEDGDGQVDSEPDRTPAWKVPGFSVFDANARYRLPLRNVPVGVEVFANVFNLFDATYIQDATDNSAFNAFDYDHDADDAEVFLGLPRRFNVGIRLTY